MHEKNERALFQAVKEGDVGKVLLSLKNGANINAVFRYNRNPRWYDSSQNYTALLLAISGDNDRNVNWFVVETLLLSGANALLGYKPQSDVYDDYRTWPNIVNLAAHQLHGRDVDDLKLQCCVMIMEQVERAVEISKVEYGKDAHHLKMRIYNYQAIRKSKSKKQLQAVLLADVRETSHASSRSASQRAKQPIMQFINKNSQLLQLDVMVQKELAAAESKAQKAEAELLAELEAEEKLNYPRRNKKKTKRKRRRKKAQRLSSEDKTSRIQDKAHIQKLNTVESTEIISDPFRHLVDGASLLDVIPESLPLKLDNQSFEESLAEAVEVKGISVSKISLDENIDEIETMDGIEAIESQSDSSTEHSDDDRDDPQKQEPNIVRKPISRSKSFTGSKDGKVRSQKQEQQISGMDGGGSVDPPYMGIGEASDFLQQPQIGLFEGLDETGSIAPSEITIDTQLWRDLDAPETVATFVPTLSSEIMTFLEDIDKFKYFRQLAHDFESIKEICEAYSVVEAEQFQKDYNIERFPEARIILKKAHRYVQEKESLPATESEMTISSVTMKELWRCKRVAIRYLIRKDPSLSNASGDLRMDLFEAIKHAESQGIITENEARCLHTLRLARNQGEHAWGEYQVGNDIHWSQSIHKSLDFLQIPRADVSRRPDFCASPI